MILEAAFIFLNANIPAVITSRPPLIEANIIILDLPYDLSYFSVAHC
jgi:hypothetical protein